MRLGKITAAKQIIDGGCWLCLRTTSTASLRAIVDEINSHPGKDYDAEVKRHREKRSLDANAYAWVLIGKIADVLRTDKDSVYLDMLKKYGQGGVAKIPNDMIDAFRKANKYNEKHESLPDEEKAQYYRFWVGSSKYNTEEMSILIDGIISEAEEQGIEIATPEEIARMKEEWR